jgi:flagellin
MTVINTNIASMNAQYSLNKVNKAMEDTMQQLSTGKRINSAADDAAGLSIASTMETQLRGINMQIRNAQDGISLVQTVEGALEESSSILQRMSELATQASNSVFSADDRAALQSEVEQLKTELDRIAQDTKFNGQTILDGSYANKQLNVGFGANGNIGVDIGNHSAASLSAAGETDAMSQLTAAAASIATGLNNQAVTSTTTQAAVSKADTQAVGRTIAQINVGADNTQAVSMANVTKNLVATSTAPDKVATLAAPVMVQSIGTITVPSGSAVNNTSTFAMTQTDVAGVAVDKIVVSGTSGIAGSFTGTTTSGAFNGGYT